MYDKLKGLMRETNITQTELAQLLNMSVTTLNHKINGKSDFTIKEGIIIAQLFNKQLDEIFFTKQISKLKIKAYA